MTRDHLAVVNGGTPSRRPAVRRLLSTRDHSYLLAWLLYQDGNERARVDYDERTASSAQAADCA